MIDAPIGTSWYASMIPSSSTPQITDQVAVTAGAPPVAYHSMVSAGDLGTSASPHIYLPTNSQNEILGNHSLKSSTFSGTKIFMRNCQKRMR